jgi:hypothetical protein
MRGGEVLASGNSNGGSAPLLPATSAVGEVVVSDQPDADPEQPTVARRKQSLRTLSFEEALKARQLVRTGSEILR